MSVTRPLPETDAEADAQLPRPGTWYIDPAHSSITFTVRHLLTKVRGSFKEFAGTLNLGERPADAVVDVTIQVASIDTGQDYRDTHLRSDDFFSSETYPTATFRSLAVTPDGDDWRLTGELTIRDVTRPVDLKVEYLGILVNPLGGDQRASFSATTELNREDFGLTWNQAVEGGKLLVGKKVTLEIDVEATDAPPQP